MAEIERKYLVKSLPNIEDTLNSDILQGYISLDPEIRIRKDKDKYYLTKKSNDLLVREEIEEEITKNIFDILRFAVSGNLIRKRRYRIPLEQNLVAELDIYHDNLEGLLTVEVEFSSSEEALEFIKPEWFGEEITFDKRFKNKALSQIDSISSLIDNMKDVKSLVKKDV